MRPTRSAARCSGGRLGSRNAGFCWAIPLQLQHNTAAIPNCILKDFMVPSLKSEVNLLVTEPQGSEHVGKLPSLIR